MSWGSEGASAAGNAASGAGTAAGSGGAVSGASVTPAVTTGSAPVSAGGYAVDATQPAQSSPSFMDSTMSKLESFQKGAKQSLPEAWRERGWDNPGTYGYVAGKVRDMAASGGGSQPANVTTNISYQQPQNEYLRKRRGY